MCQSPLYPPAVARHLASSYKMIGDAATAERYYRRAVELNPTDVDSLKMLSELYKQHRKEIGYREMTERVETLSSRFRPVNEFHINFGDIVEFLGYDISEKVFRHGDKIGVTFYWRCLRETVRSYSIFVHFRKDGRTIFQADHIPDNGKRPTTKWREGELIKESVGVVVPDSAIPGSYDIFIGLNDSSIFSSSFVIRDQGANVSKEVKIGTIEVMGRGNLVHQSR